MHGSGLPGAHFIFHISGSLPLLLIVNATFFLLFPHQPVANAYGLILALCVSILGGALFYKWVESQPFTNKKHLLLPADSWQVVCWQRQESAKPRVSAAGV